MKSLDDRIEDYISFKQSLGFKRATYEGTLHSFSSYVNAQYPNENELTEDMVMDFLESQPTCVAAKATKLRDFAKYLNAIGEKAYVVHEDLFETERAADPYIFSDKELHLLFNAIDHKRESSEWKGILYPTMFRLIYTCGLRPRECRVIKAQDIDFKTGEILIRNSKKHKDRIIVMSDDMLALCKKYKRRRNSIYSRDGWFFCTDKGNIISENTLNNEFMAAWKIVYPDWVQEKGKRVRVYCLRHRFATAVIHKWIDEKADLRNKLSYLQAYMGHERLTETVYYVHLLPENLVKSAGIDWNQLDGVIPEVQP